LTRGARIASTSTTSTVSFATTALANAFVTQVRQGLVSTIDPSATIVVLVNGVPQPVIGPLPLAVPVPNANFGNSFMTNGYGTCGNSFTCAQSPCSSTGTNLTATVGTLSVVSKCTCNSCLFRQTTVGVIERIETSACANSGTTQAAYDACAATIAQYWQCLVDASSASKVQHFYIPPTYGGVTAQAARAFPACNSGSKKGLLGLLGLLGLIPLLLCCLLLICCLRRKKADPDVHFATFDPATQAVPGHSQIPSATFSPAAHASVY